LNESLKQEGLSSKIIINDKEDDYYYEADDDYDYEAGLIENLVISFTFFFIF